jgi:hypothetical protein
MTVKDFDAAKKEVAGESIEFGLGGVTFRAPLPIPATTLLDVAAMQDAEGLEAARLLGDALFSMIDATQVTEFRKVLREQRTSVETLVEIFKFLIEESSGYPTEPQSA